MGKSKLDYVDITVDSIMRYYDFIKENISNPKAENKVKAANISVKSLVEEIKTLIKEGDLDKKDYDKVSDTISFIKKNLYEGLDRVSILRLKKIKSREAYVDELNKLIRIDVFDEFAANHPEAVGEFINEIYNEYMNKNFNCALAVVKDTINESKQNGANSDDLKDSKQLLNSMYSFNSDFKKYFKELTKENAKGLKSLIAEIEDTQKEFSIVDLDNSLDDFGFEVADGYDAGTKNIKDLGKIDELIN